MVATLELPFVRPQSKKNMCMALIIRPEDLVRYTGGIKKYHFSSKGKSKGHTGIKEKNNVYHKIRYVTQEILHSVFVALL